MIEFHMITRHLLKLSYNLLHSLRLGYLIILLYFHSFSRSKCFSARLYRFSTFHSSVSKRLSSTLLWSFEMSQDYLVSSRYYLNSIFKRRQELPIVELMILLCIFESTYRFRILSGWNCTERNYRKKGLKEIGREHPSDSPCILGRLPNWLPEWPNWSGSRLDNRSQFDIKSSFSLSYDIEKIHSCMHNEIALKLSILNMHPMHQRIFPMFAA